MTSFIQPPITAPPAGIGSDEVTSVNGRTGAVTDLVDAGGAAAAQYDDFTRLPVGPIAGVQPIVGVPWQVSGTVPTVVADPGGASAVSSTGLGYLLVPIAVLDQNMVAVEVCFTGTPASLPMTIGVGSDATVTNVGAHFNFGPQGWVVTCKEGAVFRRLLPLSGNGQWSKQLANDGTYYRFFIKKVNNETIALVGPNGEEDAMPVPDTRIAVLSGGYIFLEPATVAGAQAFVRRVEVVSIDTTAPFGQFDELPQMAGVSLTDGQGRTAGNRGGYGQVSIGINSAGQPSVEWGSAAEVTYLAAPVVAGALAVSTVDKIPNGSSVILDTGLLSETVTSTASSTGAGSPFSTAVTALVNGYPTGTMVLVTAPAAAVVEMPYNRESKTISLPNATNGTILQSAGFYLSPAQDCVITRSGANVVQIGTSAAGCVRTGRTTTGARPSAATVGAGSATYDSTLNRPITSDGANWRVTSSTIATGSPVLVAGTVVVADANITANSVIRLSSKTLGGTPGALFVSAKSAGVGFTISSTNVADTSTVFYEILDY